MSEYTNTNGPTSSENLIYLRWFW